MEFFEFMRVISGRVLFGEETSTVLKHAAIRVACRVGESAALAIVAQPLTLPPYNPQ
jgi:hypothetical protein